MVCVIKHISAAYVPAGSRNPPASVSASSAFPAGSRNPPAIVSTGRAFPAGSRNRPAFVSASRPFSAGLAVITNCTWIREDGELLLRPQQVVLGKLKGHICSGDPRTMVDLINLHGRTVTFGGGDGKITGKGTIRTSKLNFENV
ncbi:hypothetical protein Tco_1241160 [Tanacetum coccineum]